MMRAAVYRGVRDITIEDLPIPTPGPGEILIRIGAVGICGTDAHEYESGPQMFPLTPFTPGHEFAGHIVELGPGVAGFAVGDLVATGAGVSCGECFWCRSGKTNLCKSYQTLGLQLQGGLAQFALAPANTCLEVGSLGLTLDSAALAQPMSIAVHSMKRGRPDLNQPAMVIGAGGIGTFLIHALAQHDVTTLVVELDPMRREVAMSLGAAGAVMPDDTNDGLGDLGGDGVPSVIYEVTGTPAGLDHALSHTAPGTRVVVIGLQDGEHPIRFRELALREIELIGTNAHVFGADFAEAARLLSARSGSWSDVAPVAFPLDDLVEHGLKPLIEGSASRIKTLIDPWASAVRDTT